MSVRLDWQVGPAGDDDGLLALRPPQVLPRSTPRRFALTPGFLALYCLALAAAGLIGFGIGRWSEARATLRAGIERSVGLETAAWHAADGGLMAETLDPAADAGWRSSAAAMFQRQAPDRSYAVLIRELTQPSADRLLAVMDVHSGGTLRREERTYQRRDGGWYRLH